MRTTYPSKRILVKRYDYALDAAKLKDEDYVSKQVQPVWKEFRLDYFAALDSKARTVVVDTGTWAHEAIRLAKFGTLVNVPPVMYGPVNAQLDSMLLAAENSGKIVIWIHKAGEKWVDGKNEKGKAITLRTGELERKGFKNVGFAMQASLRTYKRDGVHGVRVMESGFGTELEGLEFEDEQCAFPNVAAVLTGTKQEDWE